MILYYTGVSNAGESQSRVSQSLGNYISSTKVPNDTLGATFSEISRLTVQNNDKQIFCLALTNTTGSDVTDITVYYDYPSDNKYKLELAFVSPALDSDSNPYFESIASTKSAPINATFAEYSGVGNAINIGNLTAGSSIGLWFKCTLVAANIAEPTCDALHAAFVAGTATETEQELTLSISYT